VHGAGGVRRRGEALWKRSQAALCGTRSASSPDDGRGRRLKNGMAEPEG
jgi:hypothetical protein